MLSYARKDKDNNQMRTIVVCVLERVDGEINTKYFDCNLAVSAFSGLAPR